MESLQAIAPKAIAHPMEKAKKLHEKHPLARDLCKEEHKWKFRQLMSQLICLSTFPCAEWCYLYGQSLSFGGFICQHCCRILEERQTIDLKTARRKVASERIHRELEKQFRNIYLYV